MKDSDICETIHKLDIKDRKILALLSMNSRMAISEIARRIKMNKDTVKYRLNRLVEIGIIKKFFAQVNPSYFGYLTCHVFFILGEHNEKDEERLIKFLESYPNTKQLIQYHDKWDFEWIIITKGVLDFDRILTEFSNKIGMPITEREEFIEVDSYYMTNLPDSFFPMKELTDRNWIDKSIKLDNIDNQILKILGEDARINATEISSRLKKSVDAIINRIKRLEKGNIITRFSIKLNRKVINYQRFIFAVNLKKFDDKWKSRLKEFVRLDPYVMRCIKVLGTWDILIYISSSNNIDFHNTVKKFKREFSEIIREYDTWMAYEDVFFKSIPDAIFD